MRIMIFYFYQCCRHQCRHYQCYHHFLSPPQTFATSNLPIRKLDFSNNAIRRLPDKAFAGIQVYNTMRLASILAYMVICDINILVILFPSMQMKQETLTELRLSNNLLGDSLNPIFSTIEFQVLENLRLLDISGNRIKAIEEGILKGCHKLQVSFKACCWPTDTDYTNNDSIKISRR
jgi:hypothetical protein